MLSAVQQSIFEGVQKIFVRGLVGVREFRGWCRVMFMGLALQCIVVYCLAMFCCLCKCAWLVEVLCKGCVVSLHASLLGCRLDSKVVFVCRFVG